MNHRRRKLQRAALLGMLVVTAAVFVCSGVTLFARRNNEGFTFVEQEGDASVLGSIRITGVLSDSFQRVSFASQGRAFTHRTLRQALSGEAANESRAVSYAYEPAPGAKVETKFYEAGEIAEHLDGSMMRSDNPTICETAEQFVLYLEDESTGAQGSYRLQTQVTYHKEVQTWYYAEHGRKTSLMTTSLPLGFFLPVRAEGREYAATVTDADCRGTGGIYDLTDMPAPSSAGAETIQKENLFPIDLQGGKVTIISMEACGENLALFTRTDGQMTVYLIDPRTWAATKTISLPGWEGYQFYSVKDHKMFLASSMDGAAGEDPGEASLWRAAAIDLEGANVLDQIEDTISNGIEGAPYHDIVDFCYDGKSFYLLSLVEQRASGDEVLRDEPAKYPCLIVYQNGKKVFSCAIQSGQQEDKRCATPNIRQYEALHLQKGGDRLDSD